MERDPTLNTRKNRLRFPVRFGDMPTSATSLRGMSRIDGDYRNPSNLCLIFNEGSQLTERPFTKSFPLRFANRWPEAFKLFNGNAFSGVFGGGNDLLGNHMVTACLESSFFAREFFQMALGRLSTFLLKCGLDCGCFDADNINGPARVNYPVRRGRNILDSHIDAKEAFWINRRSIRQFYHKAQIEFTFLIEKICLSSNASLFQFGIRAEHHRDFDSAIHRQHGSKGKIAERKKSLIIHNRGIFSKCVKAFSFRAIRLRDFANSTNGELGGKTKFLPHIPITQMVKSDLSKGFVLICRLRDVVAGLIKDFDGSDQRCLLFRRGKQFHFYRQFHSMNYRHILSFVKKGRMALPFWANHWGICVED